MTPNFFEEEHDRALNRILKQGLIQSRAIVGLVSKNYGQSSDEESTNWTLQEWQANNYKRILYEIDQQPKGTLENLKRELIPKPNLPLAYCNLKNAAREIRRCLTKQKNLTNR